MNIKLNKYGNTLTSRGVGRMVRLSITTGEKAVIDLEGVELVCGPFADELFAVLVQDHGS